MRKITHLTLAACVWLGSSTLVLAQAPPVLEYRATLDPFKIHQLPEFLMHSRAHTDLVFQRLTFQPGPGAWHIHNGASFVYVVSGQIKLQTYNRKRGCNETPIYKAGDAFIEPGGVVHRAVVLGTEPVTVMLARVNVPVGAPLTVPVSDPGCSVPDLTPLPGDHTPATDPPSFTYRATLDAFQIHQLPGFLVHSGDSSDIVIQRSIFQPGPRGWHYHPGSSFIYVVSGNIKLEKFDESEGCIETPVYGPGDSYYEIGGEMHQAVVTSAEPAVLMVVRFNIPVGANITYPVPDPCAP